MIEVLEFDGCENTRSDLGQALWFPSVSVTNTLIKSHRGPLAGTGRASRITDSICAYINVGTPSFGAADSCIVTNTRANSFAGTDRDDAPAKITPSNDMTLLAKWSFSNGTFTRNMTGVNQSMNWQIPGAKIHFSNLANGSMGSLYPQQPVNMGLPFTILNVTMDGSGNFSFDTTLKALPTIQTSATVTISIASPGVVTWTAHGLAANTTVMFTTTGALPSPLSVNTPYWVLAPTANTFEIAASVGGAAINTSGTQSGTHTAWGNPLCFVPHPCPRLTCLNNSGCLSIIDMGGAVDEPMYSRVKRVFAGQQLASSYAYQSPYARIWGYLVSLTVNVIQPATAGTLNITCPGFTQPNFGTSTFSQTVSLTTAGKRVITNTAVTGNQTGDTLVAYADWVAGDPLLFNFSGTPAGIQNNALVTVEMLTDQGLTRFATMMGGPAAATSEWIYSDAGILAAYPA
jgi:hypothetical protein